MKKIYLSILSLLAGVSILSAQSSISLTDEATGLIIPNGGTIYRTTTAGVEDLLEVNFKNTSASTKAYKVRRYDDVVNSGASSFFCVQACYPPTTMVSPTSLTLTPNQDAESISVFPSFHLQEASTIGVSEIRYKIYNVADASDEFYVTVKYNAVVSVKTISSVFTSVSDVFPNPSTGAAYLTIVSAQDAPTTSISIVNSLGSVVSSKTIELSSGKNKIALDTESLSTGLYFVTLSSGNTKIVKKITINK